MKKFLLFFILLSKVILSQNYTPIIASRNTWFKYLYGTENRIQPIRIDSVKGSAGDTSYYNYKIVDYANRAWTNCVNQTDTNFFIDRILAKQSGDCFFFNRKGDSILLKPYKPTGSSWVLYLYSNGDHIDATVDSIIQYSVLGNSDSVKFISLQTRNTANNPIGNKFNGKKILLGKSSGLTRFYNTFDFPTDTTSFNLVGKSNPLQGVTNLRAAQIYDWNVGDIFQYKGGHNAAPNSASSVKEQFTVISKIISANSDTITYLRDHIYCRADYQFNPFDSTIYNHRDTVIQKVVISEKAVLDYYSYESIYNVNSTYGYLYQFSDNQYFSRMKKSLNSGFMYSAFDGCVIVPVGWCIYPILVYAEGIGLVSSSDNSSTTCFKNNIVYYKRGTEIWGNQITMCSLTGISSYSKKNNIAVYPSPSDGSFLIKTDFVNIESIEIYNTIGERVFSKNNLQQNFLHVNLSSQPKGVYYVSVNAGGKNTIHKICVQ